MSNVKTQLEDIRITASKCSKCPLCQNREKSVFSDGCASAPIMFIGEAPGKNENETGIPFIGRAGQLLRKYLFETGYKSEDFYIANTVKCRPPQNRKPTKEEKSACRSYLDEQIKLVNPKIIVLVGSTAMESFIEDKKLTITKARGNLYQIDGRTFVPIFHPSYLLRYHSLDENSPRDLFKKDLIKIKQSV